MLICGFAGWERACRMVKVDCDATESLALHRLSLTSHCPCAAFRWARVNRLCGGALSCLSLHGKPRAAVPPCSKPAVSVNSFLRLWLTFGRPASCHRENVKEGSSGLLTALDSEAAPHAAVTPPRAGVPSSDLPHSARAVGCGRASKHPRTAVAGQNCEQPELFQPRLADMRCNPKKKAL